MSRLLETFFRALRGEELSVQRLSNEYGVSSKSITRDITKIKSFLADNRELVNHAELKYNYGTKSYHLTSDEFLTDKELFAIAKVILGVRAFSTMDAVELIAKFKKFTTAADRKMLEGIVRKELHHYTEIKHDCNNVIDTLWKLINTVHKKQEITIWYFKMDRTLSEKRIQPVSLVFMEYYFYLIAYYPGQYKEPRFFRIDRIRDIVVHRKIFDLSESKNLADSSQIPNFDEVVLRKQYPFMFYGKYRKNIRFLFTGPSVQAILDRLPSAKVIEAKQGSYIIEADIYGDGIKMFLLSQGSWVKVLGPPDFIDEMKLEIEKMQQLYV
ncbi:MAG: WYL domain-containing protein [Defluviitaleaceae bacterium]|nr:WYL domain-containing protein [Defluviitaleaceae bacterium]